MDAEKDKETQAIDTFMKYVISGIYDAAINGMHKWLDKGPAGRGRQEELRNLHDWYQDLSDENKKMVDTVVERSIESSVFGFLVMLDNLRGGPPIKDRESDFLFIYKHIKIRNPNTITIMMKQSN